jgi:alpha-mannosidase
MIEARLNRFVAESLLPALYQRTSPLTVTSWEVPDEPIPFADAVANEFTPFNVGQTWGLPWGTTWFHITGEVPSDWDATGNSAEILIDLGFDGAGSSVPVQYPQWERDLGNHQPGFQAEGLVYDPTGKIIKAIEPFNRWIAIEGTPGTIIDFYIEAASNANVAGAWSFQPTPLGDKKTAPQVHLYRVAQMDIAVLDLAVWNLNQDIIAMRGLMKQLSDDSPRKHEILLALEAVIDLCDPDDVRATASEARKILEPLLSKPAHASAHEIVAVGHAHIDSAWLWPVRETIRKCARTFSNVLDLMDRDPDFTFACSSAQQFAWMKEFYPQVFEGIKKRVAEGRFIPVGGMWVESDSNMPGSEALARQFIYGQGFFNREFGVVCNEVWLPDTFGYTGALPQIGVAAGAEHFFTQKMSWNDTDRMPHHTFNWAGIDGTQIFTHFTPVDSYNSDLGQTDLAKTERQYAEKGASNISMIPFGWGDGGGGPTREMLAAGQRASNLEGSPKVTLGTPAQFFEQAKSDYANPPVWFGEMYLEYHRGVLTSQLKTKQGNRRNEHLLREAELWATTAHVRTGKAYPTEELATAWQSLLLMQFHDILPGSSIAWVHQEAERKHEEMRQVLEALIADSLSALSGDGPTTYHFNATPYAINRVAALSASVKIESGHHSQAIETSHGYTLENRNLSITINTEGLITSIFDKVAAREIIPTGASANVVQIYRDLPTVWDAWEIEDHYMHNLSEIRDVDSIELITENSAGSGVRISRSFGNSHIVQDVLLLHGSKVVEIESKVDWHETHKLMKLAFAIDIQTDSATSEIQFGNIKRPIHKNTSWDIARFETCAQRWLHVSEPTYGVTIANDSTYGHDVTRKQRREGGSYTQIRESILRAPIYPDPTADQGQHIVRTSITVGSSIVESIAEGLRMNLPLRSHSGLHPVEPLLVVGDSNVVVEAIKLAEDGSGDVIVRMYEGTGDRANTEILAKFDYQKVVVVDLLERTLDVQDLLTPIDDCRLQVELRPFKIVTLRFIR